MILTFLTSRTTFVWLKLVLAGRVGQENRIPAPSFTNTCIFFPGLFSCQNTHNHDIIPVSDRFPLTSSICCRPHITYAGSGEPSQTESAIIAGLSRPLTLHRCDGTPAFLRGYARKRYVHVYIKGMDISTGLVTPGHGTDMHVNRHISRQGSDTGMLIPGSCRRYSAVNCRNR